MAIKFNRSQTFATNGTVTAAGLHNLIDGTDIYQALITDQTNLTSVGSADELLIADADLTANDAPRAVTVNELFEDALTISTYTNGKFTNLSFTNATGNSTVSTTLTAGTTTSTAANITNGTVQTLAASTATISTATISTATITGGTFSGAINSTVGTIGNFTTTLAGDFTISQGTGTLGTTGATSGTYGTGTVIPIISVDGKGRITSIGTSPAKILQVVEHTYSTLTSIASTSFTDTGLSGTITPTSSSSDIIVFVWQEMYVSRSATTVTGTINLVKTVSATSSTMSESVRTITAGGATSVLMYGNPGFLLKDSPGTTSQITYKTQGKLFSTLNSAVLVANISTDYPSRMILVEVSP